MSGVHVVTNVKSTSFAVTPACSTARSAALVGSELIPTGDSPLSDSCPCNNPGIIGIQQPGNIGVGYDLLWYASTDPDARTSMV